MKRALLCFLAVLINCHFDALAVNDQFYSQVLSAMGTNRWHELHDSEFASLTNPTNAAPRLTRSKLNEVKVRPAVEVIEPPAGAKPGDYSISFCLE